jgi:hypothetical protein
MFPYTLLLWFIGKKNVGFNQKSKCLRFSSPPFGMGGTKGIQLGPASIPAKQGAKGRQRQPSRKVPL